jgi:hypothetical protein
MNSGSPRIVLFFEVQRFRQIWFWILNVFLAGLSWCSFLQQIVYKKPFGTHPAPDSVVWIIWAVFGIGFPVFFLSFGMTTEIREDGIQIRFFPFHRRFIDCQDIQSFEVKEYHPLRDYGGWGVRWSPMKGMAYNVCGNRGVQLELKNGKRVLIGSQEPERLANMLGGILQPARE